LSVPQPLTMANTSSRAKFSYDCGRQMGAIASLSANGVSQSPILMSAMSLRIVVAS